MQIEVRLFADDGDTPNHPTLPLVIMRGAGVVEEDDPAGWFEERFASHGWTSAWRWGVYSYHHFHTSNHEVLGVATGKARLKLGGERGEEFVVRPGDVVLIPAGVGHKCLEASEDFIVVGAYPGGKEPDLKMASGEASDRERIASVPLPDQDPLHGADGPLFDHWKA
jgi:uncharacterized protein YjlB